MKSYQYQPLKGDEIRVLRVDPLKPGESDLTPIHIGLEHIETIRQEPRLSFWALSYVWGSPANRPTVYINGAPLEVTVSLHTALAQYRRQLLGDSRRNQTGVDVLWVDAICINQNDVAERSLQVPRMTEIYGRCERVLAWLGPLSEEEDADVSLLVETLPRFDDGAFLESWDQTPRGTLLQGRLRKALAMLGMRPWFHRVWILQEFVLSAKPPVVLCGRHTIDFSTFIAAWNRLVWQMLESRGISPHVQWMISPNAYRDIKASHGKRADVVHGGIASELLTILDQANTLRATQDHDQIYALLGLLSDFQALPPSLKPDYEKSFAKVYHEYTTFLLEKTGDTRILLLGSLGAVPGVPSWVPDLRNRVQMEVAPGHPAQRHITISPDSKMAVVSAIPLGRITHTFPSQGELAPRANETEIPAPLLEIFGMVGNPEADPTAVISTEVHKTFPVSAFKAFEQAIIIPAAEIQQVKPEHLLQTWQRFRLPRMFGDRWQLMEPIFEMAYSAMKNGTTATTSIPEDSPAWDAALTMDRFLQLAKLQDMLLGLPQFVLANGQTGHLPTPPGNSSLPACEVGDMIVIFQGCEYAPFLVRESDGGRYKVVSPVALDQYPQGLHAHNEIVKGFRSSFEGKARGEHTEHSVIKLEIV